MATEVISVAAPVELANAMQAGFQDALTRIEEVGVDPKATLVDQIPSDVWAAWDASDEVASVFDPDGIDGFEDDGILEPAAA